MKPAVALLLFAPLLLAACGDTTPPKPRESEGQRARAAVDAATQTYGNCVLAAAEQVPIAGDPPGTVAGRALKACPAERAALVRQVGAFHRIGNPSKSGEYSDAVADASVKALEGALRERAVIAVVGRG